MQRPTMNPENLSKKYPPLALLITILLMVAGLQSLTASVVPVNLQCEYRLNPLGIDILQPHLMWQVQSGQRDQVQTAYEILVADSAELLKNDKGNLWDSSRISSDETV